MALSTSSRSKLWILMITAFIDMVGLLMVIPLLPFYAKSLGAGGLVVGTLISSFAVAQLISAPMWGRFSDAYGRRPALLVGLGASVIAYIIFAFALSLPHPLFFLFLSRVVQGAGGGTVSVIQAYVADATQPNERAKAAKSGLTSAVPLTRPGYSRSWCMRIVPYMPLSTTSTTTGSWCCTAVASSFADIRKSPSPAMQTAVRPGCTAFAAIAAGTP